MKHMAKLLFLIAIFAIFEYGTSLQIVSKKDWGARTPKSRTALATPVSRVFVHHTATPSCNTRAACRDRLKSIQNYHIDTRGWADIGYSFLMDTNGIVYEGRGWTTLGAHTLNYNSVAIGISFIGDYTNTQPTTAQKTALNELISFGVQNRYIKANYLLNGHRDVGCTACPGNALYGYVKTLPNYDSSKKGGCK